MRPTFLLDLPVAGRFAQEYSAMAFSTLSWPPSCLQVGWPDQDGGRIFRVTAVGDPLYYSLFHRYSEVGISEF